MSARLIACLRWHRWSPDEAAALAARRAWMELRRRHLRAAVRHFGRDRELCAWHARRLAEIHRRGVRA